jgi:hypothetical protein
VMSCHQWVVSVIHYACFQTKTSVPPTFQIVPHLAWADRLNYSAQNDNSVKCIPIKLPVSSAGIIETTNKVAPKEDISQVSGLYSFFKQVQDTWKIFTWDAMEPDKHAPKAAQIT